MKKTPTWDDRTYGLTRTIALLGCILLLVSAMAVAPRAAAQETRPADTARIRIEGYLKALSPGKWVIGEWFMLVDEHTIVIEKRGRAEVGAWVVAWGIRDEVGALYAELIQVDRPAGRSGPLVQFSGPVTKQSGQWWVIGEQLVEITDRTQISGSPGRNWLVWVIAEDKGAALQALAIEAIAETPAEQPVEFEGIIEAWDAGGGQIDGHAFVLAEHPVILGEPAVGQAVEVQATRAAAGLLVVHLLRVVDTSAEAEVSAFVAGIVDEGAGEQTWDVIVFPPQPWGEPLLAILRVGPNTWVDESRAVVRPGLWAEVRGAEIAQGEIQADVIRLEQPIPVSIEGELEPVVAGNKAWGQVNGQMVWLGPHRNVQAASSSGGQFSIKGVRLGNGVIWAQQLRELVTWDRRQANQVGEPPTSAWRIGP